MLLGVIQAFEDILEILQGKKEKILNAIEDNPLTRSRAVGRALGVSHVTVLRILHEDRMHPYHLQRVQVMTLVYYFLHLNFVHWYL